jgi:mono/diheme cytochrome c family protein
MRGNWIGLLLLAALPLAGLVSRGSGSEAREPDPTAPPAVPTVWDDVAIASLEVPLPFPAASPVAIKADLYYRIPVRPIYQSYPIYHPSQEPKGYWEWLKRQEPRIVFDDSRPRTTADWIREGELVFDAPSAFDAAEGVEDARNPAWYRAVRPPMSRDGTLPFRRWVIREKGKVEIGVVACAECHTRVLPDGTILKGAPGNFPLDRDNGYGIRRRRSIEEVRRGVLAAYGAPWVKPDPWARLEQMSREDIAAVYEAIPPGMLARHRSNIYFPMQVGDLIGIKEKRYLDASGLVQHRSMGDLMRYAALNQGADFLSHYGEIVPQEVGAGRKLNLDSKEDLGERYSDAQLYALAQYLYSLKPPPNPNRLTALAIRGRQVFTREACASCHTPPLYTNNKLTPAEGFEVPPEHQKKYDVLPVSVGTDPSLTMRTARGTGYYKVPTLKGLWYRGPYMHGGWCATLDDFFDPRRLRDDYTPTGFRGVGRKIHAVKGHIFGLSLPADDRKALVAFLKTL